MRHLIGLGFRCDVAFQLRMHGDENVAHFFDWLATPAEGVIKIIESDFDVFHPDHLVLKTDHNPHCVEDKLTGTVFHHQFPMFAGHVPPNFLLFYGQFIKKFQYLASRFRTYLETKPVTLVRQQINREQALRLEEAVFTKFPGADVQFLYIVNNGEEFETPHGHARILKNDGSSLGDPAEWAKVLFEEGLSSMPYRHGTAEILGSAHDDHNLSIDNRFSEAQLLVAIDANPQSPVFPLELSRWYMARGQLKRAEEMAVAALARTPKNQDALYQATLMQWRLGTVSDDEAANVFCDMTDTKSLPSSWLVEASTALQKAGKIEQALHYAVRAVAYDPLNQKNFLQKSSCLLDKKEYFQAALAINAALKFGPIGHVDHHRHALILLGLGHTEEAIEAEQNALAMVPGFFPSLFTMAGVLASKSRIKEALEVYGTALPVAGIHIAAVEEKIRELNR